MDKIEDEPRRGIVVKWRVEIRPKPRARQGPQAAPTAVAMVDQSNPPWVAHRAVVAVAAALVVAVAKQVTRPTPAVVVAVADRRWSPAGTQLKPKARAAFAAAAALPIMRDQPDKAD